MRSVINLVRLQFKLYGDESFSKRNLRNKLAVYLPIAICMLGIAGISLYAFSRISEFFIKVQLSYEFLSILFLAVQAIQFILGIAMVSNSLFGASNADLIKLPVSGLQIFSSKAIHLFIKEFIFSTSIILPMLLLFGATSGQHYAFFLMIPVVLLLFPIVPFIAAMLFAVPAILLRKLVKNKFLLVLIGNIIFISIGYLLYIKALEITLNTVFLNTAAIVISPQTAQRISMFSTKLIPQILLTNLLFLQDVASSIAITLMFLFISMTAVLAVANKWYYAAFIKEVENIDRASVTKSRYKKGGVFAQLINREFLNIFRSVSYSLQFLALAASAPVMVYACSKLSIEIGVGKVGALIQPGIILLVVLMFVALSSSFSASAITREGNKFYHMKTIPCGIKTQVTAKLLCYSVVSVASIVISCIVLVISAKLRIEIIALICFSSIFMGVGGICNSIKRDIVRPSFHELGMGDMTVTNNNTIASIAIGIFCALALGSLVIYFSYSDKVDLANILMISVSFCFFIVSIFRLYFRLKKSFNNIEP